MRKLTKQNLSKNEGILDKLWRSVGKENAVCEVCATLHPSERVNYTQIHPHHAIGRGHHITRWSLLNRIWLCPTHHTLGKHSAINWLEKLSTYIYRVQKVLKGDYENNNS